MSKKSQIFEYKEDINGKVPGVFSWSFDYNYLCCGGDKSNVYIIDKYDYELQQAREKTERHTTSIIIYLNRYSVCKWLIFAQHIKKLENEPKYIYLSMQYFANNMVYYYKILNLKNHKAFQPATFATL